MNRVLFEKVCELEAKLNLESNKRWQAEEKIINLEKEITRLKYLLSLKSNLDETT